ncbi:hypothetical protein FQN60_004832 [Etheostoma spectabile]|uniref:CID domain-containing protein n=1 Tax=Etheostoma spectabile TaxID=54343 RepID=A0A5J5DLA9_9PERO|nr:hypothetical protein FQN60_004832 [Etheostoma spectabile]
MDAVNAFNMELFSMIDMKPPISRAKMMSLYKHVVQIVEKFIKKCKPELKVPGLYVVDSIVRQSRHQFGVDKDVFAARFLKNFTDTFQNLYCCPEDDKNKIIRVLNLWQKNGVFDMDIIQPLMDMANGDIVSAPALEVTADAQPETQLPVSSASVIPAVAKVPSPDALAAVAQLFQSPHGQELQRMLQNFQQADKNLTTIANHIPNPPQVPVAQPNPYSAHTEKKSSLAEKLLDRFDYDDEPEDMMAKEGSAQTQGIPENVFNQYPGQMSNAENVHPHMTGQTGGMEGNSREDSSMRREGRHRGYGRRSRSRSGSRSRHRRSRSREQRRRSRSGSHDRNEREKDRDRRQKGLPSIKSQTLSDDSSEGIAWALNKGIKSAHKKFWDVERGVTYIPWSKVKVEELESYREGGILDADTLNPEWNHGKDLNKQAAVNGALESVPADGTSTAHIQVMLMQSLNTFLLKLQVLLFYWYNGLGVGGLLKNLSCGGKINLCCI